MIKNKLQAILGKFGYVLVKKNLHRSQKRFYRDFIRHSNLLKSLDLDCILDVGAHEGGFAEEMFDLGYNGKMISFEPIGVNYNVIQKKAENKNNWYTYQMALGNKKAQEFINVSENLVSSSLLEINFEHIVAAPESNYVRKEMISINRLDDILSNIEIGSNTMLKIDTQGFEMKVLEGAVKSLKKVMAVKVELSSISLYEGGPLFYEVSQFLYENNFLLASVENGFYDPENFTLLQFDGLFIREPRC